MELKKHQQQQRQKMKRRRPSCGCDFRLLVDSDTRLAVGRTARESKTAGRERGLKAKPREAETEGAERTGWNENRCIEEDEEEPRK